MNGCASTDSYFYFIVTSAFWMRNKDTAHCGSHGYRVARAKYKTQITKDASCYMSLNPFQAKNEQSCSLFCQN